jgi:hypothetical protein
MLNKKITHTKMLFKCFYTLFSKRIFRKSLHGNKIFRFYSELFLPAVKNTIFTLYLLIDFWLLRGNHKLPY